MNIVHMEAVLLGLLFFTSAVFKLRDQPLFRSTLQSIGVPRSMVTLTGWAVMIWELAIVAGMLSGRYVGTGAVLCFGLLVIFLAVTVWVLSQGAVITCHCFGQGLQETFSRRTWIRLIVLLAMDTHVLLTGASWSWSDFPLSDVLFTCLSGGGIMALYVLWASTRWNPKPQL